MQYSRRAKFSSFQVSPIPEKMSCSSTLTTTTNRFHVILPLSLRKVNSTSTPIIPTELNEPIRDEDTAFVANWNDLFWDIRQRQTALQTNSEPPQNSSSALGDSYLTAMKLCDLLDHPRIPCKVKLKNKLKQYSHMRIMKSKLRISITHPNYKLIIL